eukprot:6483771-Amphidinium_carterae.1
MQSLQLGVQRKAEKLAKVQQQQQQLLARSQLESLESELQVEIDKLTKQYKAKRVELEMQLATLEEQGTAAAESLLELKEQQAKLVADGSTEDTAEAELGTFCKVLEKLTHKDPSHNALFQE